MRCSKNAEQAFCDAFRPPPRYFWYGGERAIAMKKIGPPKKPREKRVFVRLTPPLWQEEDDVLMAFFYRVPHRKRAAFVKTVEPEEDTFLAELVADFLFWKIRYKKAWRTFLRLKNTLFIPYPGW